MVKTPQQQQKRRPSPYEKRKEVESSTAVIVVHKRHCSFCGGKTGARVRNCVQCRAVVCEQDSPESRGCIGFGTVCELVPFLCILCEQAGWKSATEPGTNPAYGFMGYGERKHARLDWPMVVVTLELPGNSDTFIRDAVALDVKHLGNENSRTLHALLKEAGNTAAQKEMDEACTFMQASIRSGWPANTFVVVDTHTETDTGYLQYGGGKTQPEFAPPSELISGYCGGVMLETMEAASFAAQQNGASEASGWFDDSGYCRGGWRILMLATCGQTFRMDNSFIDAKRMVERGTFDLVLGFGGRATIPGQIRPVLSALVERLGVNKRSVGLWSAVIDVVSQELDLLQATSIVAIYRERGSSAVECREIALHTPGMRPWGVEFASCGKVGCAPKWYEFHMRTNGQGIGVQCRRCGWTSEVVTKADVQEYVFSFNSTAPDVYWHTYPTCTALAAIFVTATKQKRP